MARHQTVKATDNTVGVIGQGRWEFHKTGLSVTLTSEGVVTLRELIIILGDGKVSFILQWKRQYYEGSSLSKNFVLW